MDPVLRERNADGSGAASADGSGAKPAAQSELALPVSSAAAGDSTGLGVSFRCIARAPTPPKLYFGPHLGSGVAIERRIRQNPGGPAVDRR